MRLPGTRIGARKSNPFGMELSKPTKLPPEANPWWWHPSRPGVRSGPEDFCARLREFDPTLAVTWNAYTERWQVWMRKDKIRNPICQGWMLLFPVRYQDGSYMPLDERTFARLYYSSANKWGDGLKYFKRIESEIERDRLKAEKDREDSVRAEAGEFYKHIVPSISMAGPSNGSKTSTYHS